MFSRRVQEYIIAYKLMSHNQNLVGLYIDHFTNISVDIIEKMVNDLKTHMCALNFGRLFLSLAVKENNNEIKLLIQPANV